MTKEELQKLYNIFTDCSSENNRIFDGEYDDSRHGLDIMLNAYGNIADVAEKLFTELEKRMCTKIDRGSL
jgi:hypothetical protein